ncbi:unnamed protein product [Cuscuta europaea]|uniref:Uncharacterized protein n=1 Tax=Cuscuta europaea TaxID=41803 RepID=A0A9P0YQ14_CUSEU|nr:unnamed protein product [Cuscuta europaea]
MVKTIGGAPPTALRRSSRNRTPKKLSSSSPIHINLEPISPIMGGSPKISIAAEAESKSTPMSVNNSPSSQGDNPKMETLLRPRLIRTECSRKGRHCPRNSQGGKLLR